MNANQPAYPQHGWSSNPETVQRMQSSQGLTKREEFTKAFITGLLSNSKIGDVSNAAVINVGIALADQALAKLQETEAKP